jgi:hypothetical protein
MKNLNVSPLKVVVLVASIAVAALLFDAYHSDAKYGFPRENEEPLTIVFGEVFPVIILASGFAFLFKS